MKIGAKSLPVLLLSLLCLAEWQRALSQGSPVPHEFAPGVISTGHEFGVSFTPNGKEVYFSRSTPNSPIHIWRARLAHGEWQPPEKISLSSDHWSDLDPFISPDGKHLFFISTRISAGEGPQGVKKNMDIWVADRKGGDWIHPRRVENVNSEAKEGSPGVARDGTLYFFSDRGREANNNAIYISTLIGGHYSTPVLAPPSINSGPSDTSPYILPNGKTLLFYSTRQGGYGKADLYVSYKERGTWTPAFNLGSIVNTDDSEYNPAISPNGKQFFFGRNGRLYTVLTHSIPSLSRH